MDIRRDLSTAEMHQRRQPGGDDARGKDSPAVSSEEHLKGDVMSGLVVLLFYKCVFQANTVLNR